tara:strand:+ start:4035 stop:4364 length:330 start_codon:yes stop_codon:yes gene_type:complete
MAGSTPPRGIATLSFVSSELFTTYKSHIMAKIYDYNKSYEEIEAMPDGVEKACQYALCGLCMDEIHHKQWILEQVLKSLGQDPATLSKVLKTAEGEEDEVTYWEEGIAP